jgi:hypothetical protein
MTVAAGLVLAMIVAGIALAMGVTGPRTTAGAAISTPSDREPIVRTVTRTIRVHKTGEPVADGPAPVVVRNAGDGTVTGDSTISPGSEPDEVELDGFEDDDHGELEEENEGEDEEHEDEDGDGDGDEDEGDDD